MNESEHRQPFEIGSKLSPELVAETLDVVTTALGQLDIPVFFITGYRDDKEDKICINSKCMATSKELEDMFRALIHSTPKTAQMFEKIFKGIDEDKEAMENLNRTSKVTRFEDK